MKIGDIIAYLETIAHPSLQEEYDNAGLIVGEKDTKCKGILCCLDTTEDVVEEALLQKCNLVIAHHPIIFKGLKKLNGSNYVERVIIKAIKNNIAIYAIHTNLDNIIKGVNARIADQLGLINRSILAPKAGQLQKLYYYVPESHAETVKNALFAAGAGQIGNYSECSFSATGTGTFKPGQNAHPFKGTVHLRQEEPELKTEIIFPSYLQPVMIEVLKKNHPYEEVAYEVIHLENQHQEIGAGITGFLKKPIEERDLLKKLKKIFHLSMLKHTRLLDKKIEKVSICGGAGSFLINQAIKSKSDIYITSDIKYHEFFDADGKILLVDIGHYESEQFTIGQLYDLLVQKFPNFAILKTTVNTNPVLYF